MFFRRHLEAALVGRASRHKVRLLLGARQTGKTALLLHLLPRERTHLVNLQESSTRRRFEADPGAFAREIRALPRRLSNVVVDEIQKAPALLDEVQDLYDSAPRRWQFFLTGSSARRLRGGAANLLPGRSHAFTLHPVCGWEVAGPTHEIPNLVRQPTRTPAFGPQSLARILQLGCLPGIRSESAAAARRTLATYADHYLEEEIRREAAVRDVGSFAAFLRLAATESGHPMNLAALSQASGIAASTLKTYYQLLVDTFIGHWIPPYARRSRQRLLTTPRFLFFDVGVRNAAADVPLDGRLPDATGGPLLEQWVGQELLARADYRGRGHRVSFWRTSYGAEVDFVWETSKEDVPIEVKWTERPRPTDARHLETFLDTYSDRSKRGLLVCRCPRAQQLTDRVRAIPWSEL
jgi:predicted AAA+ superfamily ATPase